LLDNAGTHFWSIKGGLHKQIYITNRFGNRDFILPVFSCFIRKCDRFEVISDFRSLNNGGMPFPVDGSNAERKWHHAPIDSGTATLY
jgi:hypothetical protein